MKTLEKTSMDKSKERKVLAISPGVWSTDDYIRRWAKSQGMDGVCIVPLQSLHDEWSAKINFDLAGHPVQRIAAPVPSHFTVHGRSSELRDQTESEREAPAADAAGILA